MSKNESIISYTPAELRIGKETYISLYAFDPLINKLRRKRYKLNHIKSASERKKYGRDLCERLNEQLRRGWNPFVDQESEKGYAKFEDAFNDWIRRQERQMKDGIIREATYVEYASKVRNLLRYNESQKKSILYIYQLDAQYLNDFLDYIYIERGNTAKTYNNYIRVLSVACKFFLARGYINVDPTAKIKSISKSKLPPKERNIIKPDDLKKIYNYLSVHNKHFLLACYLEYYCFIRPKELSMLKISDISYKKKIIQIRQEIAKNRKAESTTIPDIVLKMMVDLEVHNHPGDHFLFSKGFMPGAKKRSEKFFRDEWLKMRRALKLADTYQFYSLKDSGVSAMLDGNIPTIAVRDQARHSSVTVTEIYAQKREKKANDQIAHFSGDF